MISLLNEMSDRFSSGRFGLLWDFYRPGILRQLGWMAAGLLCLYILAILTRAANSFGLFGLVNTMIVLPIYLGPLVFAVYRDRSLQTLLPASGIEKALFMLLYTVVAVPLAEVVIWYGIEGVFGVFGVAPDVLRSFDGKIKESFMELGIADYDVFNPLRLATELLPAVVCLYVVVSSRGQRVLKGIGGIVGTVVAMGLVSGIYGAYMGFRFAMLESDGMAMEEAVRITVAEATPTLIAVMSVIVPLLLLLAVAITWRRITKVQV